MTHILSHIRTGPFLRPYTVVTVLIFFFLHTSCLHPSQRTTPNNSIKRLQLSSCYNRPVDSNKWIYCLSHSGLVHHAANVSLVPPRTSSFDFHFLQRLNVCDHNKINRVGGFRKQHSSHTQTHPPSSRPLTPRRLFLFWLKQRPHGAHLTGIFKSECSSSLMAKRSSFILLKTIQ